MLVVIYKVKKIRLLNFSHSVFKITESCAYEKNLLHCNASIILDKRFAFIRTCSIFYAKIFIDKQL